MSPTASRTARALPVGLLLAGLALTGLASCASRANPGLARSDARKDDIRQLWMQIRDWRVELAMPADPASRAEELLAQAAPACVRGSVAEVEDDDEGSGARSTCDDACNLRDAICDNAEAICRIAGELGDDPWARDKCKSAEASCREAGERCCACGKAAEG